MSEVTLDDRGRLTLPKKLREQYGDRYRIIEVHEGVKLVPVGDNPLAALRDEFADVDKTAETLRTDARETAVDEAGE
jgi:MraZ protein.